MQAWEIVKYCGWRSDPDRVAEVAPKIFAEAAPNLANYWQGEEIGLWEAAKLCNSGNHLPADKQGIGDCVSHGYARGADYLYCCKQTASLASGYTEGQTSAKSEYIYGIAREAGGNLGPNDGSNGIDAVHGMLKGGYIPRSGVPYNASIAKQYGYKGAPSSEKEKGKIHVLQDYALLKTPQDMANALKAGQPCPICSNQGFTMTRDSNGICRPQGQWAHCMLVIGLFKLSNAFYFVILQSWGPNVPSGPTPMGGSAPDNSFGCDWDTMGRILRANDSYSLSGMAGWEPLPKIDWVM